MLKAPMMFLLTASFLSGDVLALDNDPAPVESQYTRGHKAIHSMAGCYLVDYSYTESEGLLPGYIRDSRVYDVNKNKSVKELIYAENLSSNRIRLQHILFATDMNGTLMEGSELKHTGEEWEYDTNFLFEFTAPLTWKRNVMSSNQALWTRRITNLDDGLRYQCAATWTLDTKYPEWTCNGFAPIPGREFRDMGRKDYNTLERSTRVMVYGQNWLERQENIKTVYKEGTKTPLAKELGKTWYVRLPDVECAPAQAFAKPRQGFWNLIRQAWDEVYAEERPFKEKILVGQPSRYAKIMALEEKYTSQNLTNLDVQTAAKLDIKKIIAEYRE